MNEIGFLLLAGVLLSIGGRMASAQSESDTINSVAAASAGVPPLPVVDDASLSALAKFIPGVPADPSDNGHILVNTSKIVQAFGLNDIGARFDVIEMQLYHEYLHSTGLGPEGWVFEIECCPNATTCEHLAIHFESLKHLCESILATKLSYPEGGWEDSVAEMCSVLDAYEDSLRNGKFSKWLKACYGWQEGQAQPPPYGPPLEQLPDPSSPDSWPLCEWCS